MPEGVRLPKEQLRAKLGIGERLAVRVGALLSRGVGVTEAVLEESRRAPELETLLLAPALLAGADALDTAMLRALGAAARELAVVPRDGRRIIALEEETLAETAWSQAPAAMLPTLAPSALAAPVSGANLVFTSEELAQLKMTLLTAVDSRAKIEAIRKIVYAPIDAGERGALALRALADPDSEVRQEAAVALQKLGLDPDLADALRTVASGTPRQKAVALQRVASMAGRGSPAERSVAVAMLTASLAYERDASVAASLLEALASYAPMLAEHREGLSAVIRILVKILVDQYEKVAPAARILIERVGRAGGEVVASAVWREIEGITDRRLKVFFFEMLCGLDVSAELTRELCARAAAELAEGAIDDLETRRLADALARLGDPALRALLAALPGAREDNRAALVALVDGMASGDGISAAVRNEVGEMFVSLLREGSRLLRTAIMEARCCWHPDLGVSVKRRLATDFISNLHTVRAQRFHELTAAALWRMGTAIVDPLLHVMTKGAYPVERLAAATALAEIAAETKDAGAGAEVTAIIQALRREETGAGIGVGHAVRCVGRAASSACAPPPLVMEIYVDYWGRLSKVSYAFDLLAALHRVAAGAGCDAGAAAQLAMKMLELLEAPMPDPTVSEEKTDEGTHLIVGAQTVVYTDYIPELIGGLKNLFMSGRLREGTRKGLIERLCARYTGVSEYREIWAPGNTIDFAEALGDIALSAEASVAQRIQIIETLLKNVRIVTLVRILGRICRSREEESKMFAALVGQFARRVFEMLARPEYAEREDRCVLVEALGRIAVNPFIGESKKESDETRARIVDLLIEHLGQAREARALLREVASSETLSKSIRKRIEGALA